MTKRRIKIKITMLNGYTFTIFFWGNPQDFIDTINCTNYLYVDTQHINTDHILLFEVLNGKKDL